MEISRIYISGYKDDFRFTCSCVASIRQFYPAIPITLIKDRFSGDYDTSRLELLYGVELFDTPVQSFGWGMAKLEPLFLPGCERCLILDSDTVFLGRVLDRLNALTADFVVEGWDHTREDMLTNYFDPQRVAREYPGFEFPGYVFNSGQLVATTGLLQRADFEGLVDFSEPRRPLRPELFHCGDQGLLNFVCLEKQRQGVLRIARDCFMQWPPSVPPGSVDLAQLDGEGYPFLLHWAGQKKQIFSAHPMAEVLTYFTKKYMGALARQRLKTS